MKNLTLILAGMLLFATPVFSELSDSDLQRIREVVQIAVAAEGKQIRTEMTAAINASEKRVKEYVDLKISEVKSEVNSQFAQVNSQFAQVNSQLVQVNNRIDEVGKRLNIAFTVLGWLFALVIAIGIPQLITAFRQHDDKKLQSSIEELHTAYAEVLAELKQVRAENEDLKQRMLSQSELS